MKQIKVEYKESKQLDNKEVKLQRAWLKKNKLVRFNDMNINDYSINIYKCMDDNPSRQFM